MSGNTGAEPTSRFLEANGLRHHVLEMGEGPLVLLLHGFPEGCRSWRHQLPALAAAGYRAVAPDSRGYGRTEAPEATSSYSTAHHVQDVVKLIEALGEEQAIVVGHDWGAVTAWTCARLHPERVKAVAVLSIPLVPRSSAPPLTVLRERFHDQFMYILYFQEPGVAEAELAADPERTLRLMLHAASGEAPQLGMGYFGKAKDSRLLDGMEEPAALPPWLTAADLQTAASEFKHSGFRGPLNRYRNIDRDWEDMAPHASAKVTVPATFLAGDRDLSYATNPKAMELMAMMVPDLREPQILAGAGHWLAQERPAEVNASLFKFLNSGFEALPRAPVKNLP